ncbi:MAG TPA: hypothetical protein GXX58_05820 [Gelria sp.]|jgi:hypothetical protein|nr:hypothetical protein [Gelria sp.]
MIIGHSNVQTSVKHQYQEGSHSEERLRAWVGNPPLNSTKGISPPAQTTVIPPVDTVDLSKEVQSCQMPAEEYDIPSEDEVKLKILLHLLEAFTGKKFRFKVLKIKNQEDMKQLTAWRNSVSHSSSPKPLGWGLEYDYSESYFESESLQFESTGIVKTADGREIAFSVNMQMQRSFFSHQEFHLRAGDALHPIDPLVINFDKAVTSLSPWKFEFDLDQDGQTEFISFVNPGSGFLALDLNGDNIINHGGELFGPATGNGFKELAQYDLDGNSWIDENDPIFEHLRIWTRDEDGNERLFALGEKGIGAIYLGSSATPFALKDTSNHSHGQVQSTSIFLREDGTAGTVQQIDLFA